MAPDKLEVVVQETAGLDRLNLPIRFGIRVPPAQESGWLLSSGGQPVPCQHSIVSTHPDGSPANLRFDAQLDCLRGNDRQTLTLTPVSAPEKSTRSSSLQARLSDQGLTQLKFRDLEYLASPSGLPICSVSDASTLAYVGALRHRSAATTEPLVQSAHCLSSGEVVEEWQVEGSVGPDEAFAFITSYKIYQQTPRIDIHTRLRNRGRPRYLNQFAHTFRLAKPTRAEILTRPDVSFDHLVDINLAADTLLSGWSQSGVRLSYGDNAELILATPDLAAYQDGMITLTNIGRDQDSTECAVHRIEPVWHYRGITSHAPTSHLLFHEGQTRSAHLSIYVGQTDETENLLIAGESGVTVSVRQVPTPVRRSSHSLSPLLERTIDQAMVFAITAGEYKGLLAGGRCHINRRLIEYGVNRADYAEYLLNEFERTRNTELYGIATAYADTFVDLSIHRSDEDPDSWGAVRQRYRENLPDRVRSMRGPRFLFAMFDHTGNTAYRDTALEIGQYLLRSFPDRFARQGGACRELAELFARTEEDRYRIKATEILDAVRSSQIPDGPWYEYFEPDGSASILDVHQAGLYTVEATEKPEMSSYNIIGILDAAPQLDIMPWLDVVEKAADWMVRVQDEEGAWRFPCFDSQPQWGHGIFQDVLAMLLAYRTFEKSEYLASADRGIAWAERIWDEFGYIPSVTRQIPHQHLEASLTYFYGIEALNLRMEM